MKYRRLRLDNNNGVYRPMLKGAYLMTLGQLPPISLMRNATMKSREAATLKAFRAQNGAVGVTASSNSRTPWS